MLCPPQKPEGYTCSFLLLVKYTSFCGIEEKGEEREKKRRGRKGKERKGKRRREGKGV